MKNLPCFFLISFLFFGCQSTHSIKVPGENKILLKNITGEYYNIAEAYLNLKKYDKAIEYYERASGDKSLYLTCRYKLARCYALSKKYGEAEEIYRQLLLLDGENKDLKLSLAYVYGMNGKIDEALTLYGELESVFPTDSAIVENQITLLIYSKKIEQAESKIAFLKEKFPENANIKKLEENLDKKKEEIAEAEKENESEENSSPEEKEKAR